MLAEEWLQDTVLDALAELFYFQMAAKSPGVNPSSLFLPTSFLMTARQLIQQTPRYYTLQLEDIRKRLETTHVKEIGFLDWVENHYSGFFLKNLSNLRYGDSQHLQPSHDVLPILNWLFSGLDLTISNSVERAYVEKQGFGSGSGSCAIAAHNFVTRSMDPDLPQWNQALSPSLRNSMLQDLCTYHVIATNSVGVSEAYLSFV